MRCINCGYDNLEGMKYCVKCGNELITLEEKQKRHAEGEKKVNSLYIVIGILLVILVGVGLFFVISLFLNKGDKKDDGKDDEPKIVDNVDKDTVGQWDCNSDSTAKDPTVTILLSEDGKYKIGPYQDLDNNRTEGTFSSDPIGELAQEEPYTIYQIVFKQTAIIQNGESSEQEATTTYSAAINSSTKTKAVFTNGANNKSYHCTKTSK